MDAYERNWARDKITGTERKFHHQVVHDLYSSPNRPHKLKGDKMD